MILIHCPFQQVVGTMNFHFPVITKLLGFFKALLLLQEADTEIDSKTDLVLLVWNSLRGIYTPKKYFQN